jgi:hypothetical protein
MDMDEANSVPPLLTGEDVAPPEPLILPVSAQRELDDTDESLGA